MTTKRASIKDVAELAGVSYQTVSKVLNGQNHVSEQKAQRIWEAARTLGYQPNPQARNLRAQRSHLIGYSWLTAKPDEVNHILDRFLSSMMQEAEAAQYHLLPFPSRADQWVDSYRQLIDAGQVDGFVLSGINYADERVRFLLERRFPFVTFGRTHAAAAHAWVDVDGGAGLRLATTHLLALGHRRIAALAWPEESRVGNERLAGYQAALAEAGAPATPDLILRGENTFETGYALTQRWLALSPDQRPTAIVAMNDTMAIGAIHAGQTHGLTIGRDLAIVGFDDAPMAQYLWPPLSSVRQPIREAGRRCVEVLLKQMHDQVTAPEQVMLAPELIIRASSQPA